MRLFQKNAPKVEAPKTVEDYLSVLAGKQPEKCRAARNALLAMGPEGMDALLAHLDKKVYKKPLRRELLQAIAIYLFSATVVLGGGFLVGLLRLFDVYMLCLFLFQFQFLIGILGVVFWMRRRNTAAEALTYFDDVRAIGMLIQALEFDKGFTTLQKMR